ncbi:MAG: PQQ-binding-like beta-propeller repeat protein [Candidatus Obscuribacterales bacterium]|nr:PQQ-binding-like beta-propeller repeat protein [Candidatus Obscuribacterales bacterium]
MRRQIGKTSQTLDQAIEWMKQMATALNYAHKRGVLHQDIKPDNVFITQEGNLKIGDFGLALIATGIAYQRTSQGKGSPAYMSPELCRGDPYDHRSDIYSLGAVYFELLTGELPFKATGMIEMALKHTTAPVPSALQLKPDLPPVLDKMLKQMMAKDPAERPESLAELVPQLEQLLLEMKFLKHGMVSLKDLQEQKRLKADGQEGASAQAQAQTTAPAVVADEVITIELPVKTKELKTPVAQEQITSVKPAPSANNGDQKNEIDEQKLKKLELAWTYQVDGPIGWSGAPVLNRSKKMLYLACGDQAIYALNVVTGKLVWRFQGNAPFVAGPLFSGDNLYCPASDGHLYCLSAEDGTPKWQFAGNAPYVATPAILGNNLFVAGLDGNLSCLAVANGNCEWTYRSGEGVVSSPQIAENTIFIAGKDKGLHAVTADRGFLKWRAEATAPAICMPLISTDMAYFATNDGTVHAVDITDGRPMWNTSISGPVSPRATLELNSLIYCGSLGQLYSIDKYKGKLNWQKTLAGEALGGLVAVTGSAYVTTKNGYLQSFNARSGELVWHMSSGLELDAPPLVTSSLLVLASLSGSVMAYLPPAKA